MDIKLNETPLRTSRNFNINNIVLKDVVIPNRIGKFNNIKSKFNSEYVKLEDGSYNFDIEYGLSPILIDQVKNSSNNNTKIVINSNKNQEIFLDFKFDSNNLNLVQNIEIVANENTSATVIIKFYSEGKIKNYNNTIIKTILKDNANLSVILVNFMNLESTNFITIDNDILKNSNLNYTIVDFGGRYSVTNYYSNLKEDLSQNTLNTIYLGKENQIIDLNYIAHLSGKDSKVDIDVEGALKDNSKKHFKGTIDFKKGAKNSKGNENDSCILLSKEARSISLPMLLCSEEEVEGNHSSSAGKIGEKELFYLMSRGFSKNEAMRLMVKAKFNKIIDSIDNEDLKEEILNKIDEILD